MLQSCLMLPLVKSSTIFVFEIRATILAKNKKRVSSGTSQWSMCLNADTEMGKKSISLFLPNRTCMEFFRQVGNLLGQFMQLAISVLKSQIFEQYSPPSLFVYRSVFIFVRIVQLPNPSIKGRRNLGKSCWFKFSND